MGSKTPRLKRRLPASAARTTHVEPTAIVHPSAVIGAGTRVWAFAQLCERVRVGASCVIGNGAYLDSGVRVGDRCNIHNRALLYRNLVLEDDVFVGPAAAFLNDPMPRANRIRDIRGERTTVGRGASIGASAQILPNIRIGRFAMVATGAVVTRDVPDHALVVGVPARVKGFVDADGVRLRRSAQSASHVTLSNPKRTFSLRIAKKQYAQLT